MNECRWVVLNDDSNPVSILPSREQALAFYFEWQFQMHSHVPSNLEQSDWVDGRTIEFWMHRKDNKGRDFRESWGSIHAVTMTESFTAWQTTPCPCP